MGWHHEFPLLPLKMLSLTPWEAPGAAMLRYSSYNWFLWLMFRKLHSLLCTQQRREGQRKEHLIQGLSRLNNSHEGFGISRIRPAHRHKPAGAAFCCGEILLLSSVESCLHMTWVITRTAGDGWTPPGHQFSRVTRICSMQLPHSASSQSSCVRGGSVLSY